MNNFKIFLRRFFSEKKNLLFFNKQKFKILIFLILILNIFIDFNKISNSSIYHTARKAYHFLVISSNGLLLYNNSKKENINPKVSVVVPAYNCQKYIKQAIRSIQNQIMLELDIIIVQDFSTDNTSKIIDQIGKDDKRIKIINNKKNMGLLYTRCIGTLLAKGK